MTYIPDTLNDAVAIELREARLALDLTLSDVAEKLETAESVLSRIERGKFSINVPRLVEFCELYALVPSDVVKRAEQKLGDTLPPATPKRARKRKPSRKRAK